MKGLRWVGLWLLIGGAAVGIALLAVGFMRTGKMSRHTEALAAPDFTLRDQLGRSTELSQFRGKVVLLTFLDPECTQICPLTTQSMLEALRRLGPAAAANVELLGVNANPNKTAVADVAAYTRIHQLQGNWRFLTGPRQQLEKIWDSYHVYVATKGDDVEHDTAIFLIDQNGKERNVYSTEMSYQAVGGEAQTLAKGISNLLSGHSATQPTVAVQQQPPAPLNPDESFRLTALGPAPQSVLLGSEHPHVMVFFAGWLAKPTDLSRHLAALDGYATVARRHGWPLPVAVDVLATEPSAEAASRTLASIAVGLHTPIVEDASGRLADGYEIQDLPWFVLKSPSGTILWTHAGWLSAGELQHAVSTALRKQHESQTAA